MFDGLEADLRSEAANVCFLRDGLAKLFFKFTGANEDKFFIISLIRVGYGVSCNLLMSLIPILFDRN